MRHEFTLCDSQPNTVYFAFDWESEFANSTLFTASSWFDCNGLLDVCADNFSNKTKIEFLENVVVVAMKNAVRNKWIGAFDKTDSFWVKFFLYFSFILLPKILEPSIDFALHMMDITQITFWLVKSSIFKMNWKRMNGQWHFSFSIHCLHQTRPPIGIFLATFRIYFKFFNISRSRSHRKLSLFESVWINLNWCTF